MKTYEEWENELECYSVEELERLAVELHEKYSSVSRRMKRGELTSLDFINSKPELEQVLQHRKRKLNSTFRFTAETALRFVEISDLLTDCYMQALAEAKPVIKALDKRIEDKDAFLHDYEIELKMHVFVADPWEESPGAYGVLQEITSGDGAVLKANGRGDGNPYQPDESNWNDIDELRHHKKELADHYIGYAMHELYSHSQWSLPDILKITQLWAEVVVTRQHFKHM